MRPHAQVLEALSQRVVERYVPLLHRLLDGVALLDLLAGFARFVGAGGGQYVRPTLTQVCGVWGLGCC